MKGGPGQPSASLSGNATPSYTSPSGKALPSSGIAGTASESASAKLLPSLADRREGAVGEGYGDAQDETPRIK